VLEKLMNERDSKQGRMEAARLAMAIHRDRLQKPAGAVRAVVNTQAALKRDVARAAQVGDKLFPPQEAGLIAELIRRDLPYYDAGIAPDFVAGMSQFARDLGLIERPLAYEEVVATQFSSLWKQA